jgi:hypothetical protein
MAIHGLGINPESERATVDQRPVVLRPIGDGVKRFTHDADLREMVVIRTLGFQLVPFKLHRFRKQRRVAVTWGWGYCDLMADLGNDAALG